MTPNPQLPNKDLLPCPFCGEQADHAREHDTDAESNGLYLFIKCRKCRARSGSHYVSCSANICGLTWQEVRDDWNMRTTPPPSPAAVPEGMTLVDAKQLADLKHIAAYAGLAAVNTPMVPVSQVMADAMKDIPPSPQTEPVQKVEP